MTVEAKKLSGDAMPKIHTAGFVPKFARIFHGQSLGVQTLIGFDKFDEDDCEKRMAWHLNKGYRACSVLWVLNQVDLDTDGRPVLDDDTGTIKQRTVAITLVEGANFVMEDELHRCGIPYYENARKANGAKCKGSSLPWSARFRKAPEVIGGIEA